MSSKQPAQNEANPIWMSPLTWLAGLGLLTQAMPAYQHLLQLWSVPHLRFFVATPLACLLLAVLGMRKTEPVENRRRVRFLTTTLLLSAALALAGAFQELAWLGFTAFLLALLAGWQQLQPNRPWHSVAAWCSPLLLLCIFPTEPEFDGHLWLQESSLSSAAVILENIGVPNIQEGTKLESKEGTLEGSLLVRFLTSPYLLLALALVTLAALREKLLVSLSVLSLVFPWTWFACVAYATGGIWCLQSGKANLFEGNTALGMNAACCVLVVVGSFLSVRTLRIVWGPLTIGNSGAEDINSLTSRILSFPRRSSRSQSLEKPTKTKSFGFWTKLLFGIISLAFIASLIETLAN